jgi:hypothetical protein
MMSSDKSSTSTFYLCSTFPSSFSEDSSMDSDDSADGSSMALEHSDESVHHLFLLTMWLSE